MNLSKCTFTPTQVIRFLSMLVNSLKLAFILPEDKNLKFAQLREVILSQETVSIKTLQRFAGKCISFFLAIPSAKFFSKEVNRSIGLASKNSRMVKVIDTLREEIQYWRFLDNWSGFAPWRDERHLQISLASDASDYKWGALLWRGDIKEEFGDFWEKDDDRPIHLKEAGALLNALRSSKEIIENHRVDVFVDNMPLLHAWENQKGKDPRLNQMMKELYKVCQECNICLKLHYINSKGNPADSGSRSISLSDSTLSLEKWQIVEKAFGPHSVDLMALDSNCMRDSDGVPLRHFTPYPTPGSSGVNVFCQEINKEENPYVFPPFNLILPILKLLSDQKVSVCTMVVPDFPCRPVWWPLLWSYVVDWFVLAKQTEVGAILTPSKQGFKIDSNGLKWNLFATRLRFR